MGKTRLSKKKKGWLSTGLALARDKTFHSSSRTRLARKGREWVKRGWRRWMKRQGQSEIKEQLDQHHD